ncbi:MAG: tRNA threonylcarbamoyladenosine dehydratase [Pseudobutyrivibrio sp.]|nr:tRNA threonylcarbamoyladenosine dehydratase [Pseudobutyrivibrio sp.]
MSNQFERTGLIYGMENLDKLFNSKVIIFGIGGVGGYVAEALARVGIGQLTLVDKDTVSESNINRQIIALHSTVGKAKVEVMAARIKDINPNAKVLCHECFFLPENSDMIDFKEYDYVVDAVDTVTAKLLIITKAKEAGVPVISSMGAGNKIDPSQFRLADIYETKQDPLAKVMRKECKKRGIKSLKVVYSTEEAIEQKGHTDESPDPGRRAVPGSTAFTPSVAGLIIASAVVNDITGMR